MKRSKNDTKTAISADSTMGRTLLALRAGSMTSGELNERFPGGFAITQLSQFGLVTRTDDLWVITDAGRAACPLRNPLAAQVTAMPPTATRARQPVHSPITKETTMTTKTTKTTIELAREAITKAIAGIGKADALKRDDLIARIMTDIDQLTLCNVLRKMVLDQKYVGAFGNTTTRRFYDLRTIEAPQPKAQADETPQASQAREPEASAMEFSIYDDGRLAIMDNDEVLVLPPDATRRLGRFLGCFEAVLSQQSA